MHVSYLTEVSAVDLLSVLRMKILKIMQSWNMLKNRLIFEVKILFLNILVLETQKRSFANIVQVCCVGHVSCLCEVSAFDLLSVSRMSLPKNGKNHNFWEWTWKVKKWKSRILANGHKFVGKKRKWSSDTLNAPKFATAFVFSTFMTFSKHFLHL